MNAQHLLDEATRTQNIQATAAALVLLRVSEPKLKDEEYDDKAGLILSEFLPCDSDDARLTREEEALYDEMSDAALKLAWKLRKEFALNRAN